MLARRFLKDMGLAVAVTLAVAAPDAHAGPWQPGPGYVQVPIWPATPPDAQPAAGPEFATTRNPVAGKPWTAAERVSIPTMTLYPPKAA